MYVCMYVYIYIYLSLSIYIYIYIYVYRADFMRDFEIDPRAFCNQPRIFETRTAELSGADLRKPLPMKIGHTTFVSTIVLELLKRTRSLSHGISFYPLWSGRGWRAAVVPCAGREAHADPAQERPEPGAQRQPPLQRGRGPAPGRTLRDTAFCDLEGAGEPIRVLSSLSSSHVRASTDPSSYTLHAI